MFDALAYLIDKKAFGSAVEFVANQLQNSFEKKKALLRVLYKAKEADLARQQELDKILIERQSGTATATNSSTRGGPFQIKRQAA